MQSSFLRGYVIHSKNLTPSEIKEWKRISLTPSYDLRFSPKTEVTIDTTSDGRKIALIGRAFDIFNLSDDIPTIARKSLDKYGNGGFPKALDYISYLGGRFACFLVDNDNITAIPDCHATYSIYVGQNKGMIAFASHWMLAANVLGDPPSEEIRSFMNDPKYIEPGGKYFPGKKTPYNNVSCVFPNCYGVLDASKNEFYHRRFYPSAPLPKMSPESASNIFRETLRLCVSKSADEDSLVGLTSGIDSTCTLAAFKGIYPKGMKTFTYIKEKNPDFNQIEDVLGASKLAFKEKLPHAVIPVKEVDYGSNFHTLYSKSFRDGARHPSLARSLYENLPHDCTILLSTVAETGTVFYKKRDTPSPDAKILSNKFTQSAASNDPRLIDWMEDYIEYTSFNKENLHGYSWEDLFYWEHRNAKWASLWYGEVDMTGFAISPYNNRHLVETMLSVELEERADKFLQKDMIYKQFER